MFTEPRIITKNTSAQITDLMQCESYYVSVGIVGPIGPGPLARNPKQLQTHYNNKKPPRNLKAAITGHEMILSWENSCPFVQEETGYLVSVLERGENERDYYLIDCYYPQISVAERTLNVTSVVELKPSYNRSLTHSFSSIPDGASYDINVSTAVPGAKPATQLVFASPLPVPTQLKVFPEKNGSYVVLWKEVALFKQEP